jgi:hypothetical protein
MFLTLFFGKKNAIYDIVAIDDTTYLLASQDGLLKTTKNQCR